MTTFALIHGAWHSGWCWERVGAELSSRGHDALAITLPCDDVDLACSDYAEIVAKLLEDDGEDVVVVAHSLGGLTAPLVAAKRPVREVVLVAALLPDPGRSLTQQFRDADAPLVEGSMDALARDEAGRGFWQDPYAAADRLYHDCEPALAREAVSRLRPQSRTPNEEPFPLPAWPDVPVRSIVCSEDRIVSPGWSRRAARDRLGIDSIEIAGGHSPMLSRPAELADLLLAGPR